MNSQWAEVEGLLGGGGTLESPPPSQINTLQPLYTPRELWLVDTESLQLVIVLKGFEYFRQSPNYFQNISVQEWRGFSVGEESYHCRNTCIQGEAYHHSILYHSIRCMFINIYFNHAAVYRSFIWPAV